MNIKRIITFSDVQVIRNGSRVTIENNGKKRLFDFGNYSWVYLLEDIVRDVVDQQSRAYEGDVTIWYNEIPDVSDLTPMTYTIEAGQRCWDEEDEDEECDEAMEWLRARLVGDDLI